MKKTRIALFTVIVLLLATILCACSSTGKTKLDKIINPEAELNTEVFSSLSKVKALNGHEYVSSNEWIAIFKEFDAPNGVYTYRVLNLEDGNVVAIFDESKSTKYAITLLTGIPAFTVVETETEEAESGLLPKVETKYALYGVDGKLIGNTTKYAVVPTRFTKDIVMYDYVAYSIGDDNLFTELKEVPEYLMPASGYTAIATKEHYVLQYKDKVVVLDLDFTPVYTYLFPAAAEETFCTVLDNGNLFVQYTVKLPEDASEYDLFDEDVKYEFHTVLVDVAKKSEKALDIDAHVQPYTGTALRDIEGTQFAESIENFAIVTPIIDKKMAENANYIYAALLSNDGKLEKIEFVDNQGSSLPTMIAENLYYLVTHDGAVLLNEKGEVVKTLNSGLRHVGDYFVGTRAIYDLELNEIYDFADNDASLMGTVGDSIFIKQNSKKGYDILLLNDELDLESIYTYKNSTKEEKRAVFTFESKFGYTIYDPETKVTEYFDANGESFKEMKIGIEEIASYNDTIIFAGMQDSKLVYYIMTK